MRVGVVSDTHDRLPMIDRALALLAECGAEALLHPGDLVAPFAAQRLKRWPGPLFVIYGNNDGERAGLKEILPDIQDGPLSVELGGRNILLHHFVDWCRPEQIARADVIVSGHTHGCTNEHRDGKLFLNPGECCGWVTGRCTAAVLDTDTLSAEIIDLDA
ncbi:unnamed protein product [marine sediment metagenome]|uniref:Calcineurin-like phosphoesterase domain-containing protein n=1 Tax=marine sediment metagenome TaxID=412755 RepID=X0YBY5_9ZZZZ